MVHDNTVTPEMIQDIEITENNERPDICSKCGGRCCFQMGCEIFPQDFKRWFNTDTITKEMIIKALDSGEITMDWYDGDIRDEVFGYTDEQLGDEYYTRSYYFHMRGIGDKAICGSWGSPCKSYRKGTGCSLTWEQRPTGGRSLVPPESGDPKDCRNQNLSKYESCLAWVPFYQMLEDIYCEYKDPHESDPVDDLIRIINGGFL